MCEALGNTGKHMRQRQSLDEKAASILVVKLELVHN